FSLRGAAIHRLGVAQHVLRALEHYSATYPGFEDTYRALPFGSRIVFSRIHKDIGKCHITLLRNTQLEHTLLTPSALAALAPEIPATAWPEALDITSLSLVRQLHDSVCVVALPPSGSKSEAPQELVMKAVVGDPKTSQHHPPALPRDEEMRVWRESGRRGDAAPVPSRGQPEGCAVPALSGGDARVERADAMGEGFGGGAGACFAPGERGVWAGFSAPEVACVENLAIIAMSANGEVPEAVRAEYRAKMDRFVPGWREMGQGARKGRTEGFALGWLAMDAEEREAAMVYMLGRALWCIFEGVGVPERAMWRQGGGEDGVEFPEYKRAGQRERKLIDRCTTGRVDGRRAQGVVRMGGRIVLKEGDGTESAEAVQRVAKEWWIEELERGERFLEERERKREERRESGETDGFSVFGGRPRLEEVLDILESWEEV
ncbi:hypothetical protein V498_08943, partial [Pseudogymnoascus sp. VKM F-4517 (FW-2822)]